MASNHSICGSTPCGPQTDSPSRAALVTLAACRSTAQVQMDPGVGMLGSSCDVLLPPAKKRRESGACEDPAFQVRTPASMQPNSTFLDLMFNAFDPRSLLPLDLQAERPAGAGAAGRPAPVRRAPSPGFRWFPFPSLPLFPDAVAIEPTKNLLVITHGG